MAKESKATGQKVVVCPPIGKATGIKIWPEDDRPREKFLCNAIQNQEIVKHDLNEPWKICYEEGMKWLKTSEKTTIQAIPEANPSTPLRTRRPKKLRVLLRTFGWPLDAL